MKFLGLKRSPTRAQVQRRRQGETMKWSNNLRDSPESSPSPSPPVIARIARIDKIKSIESTTEERDLNLLIEEAAEEAVEEATAKEGRVDIGEIVEGKIDFVETPFTIAKRVAGVM